jgi:hypothetical protein
MRYLVLPILVMTVLVAVATGCGGRARYDGRLVQADSLMQPSPDSALAVLSALDTLSGAADSAYRDLLLTQARYKTYQDITASDDSAITRALHWYRAHSGEREKFTRANLYKGAVMEVLGHVDSAMIYYKSAEAVADTTDYANLGQINTRIATLYLWYYVNPQLCYDKFKKSLEYYRLVGNKHLQIDCLFYMAGCSGVTHFGDSESLLSTASQLAIEIRDSANYFRCQELLCRQLAFQGDSLSRAKQIALHCLSNYPKYINNDLILDLADIYVKSGMSDSAMYYLDYVTEDESVSNPEQIKTRKYSILSKIAHIEGEESLSSHYDKLSHQVTDSIINNDQRYQIQQIENSFNNRQHVNTLSRLSHLYWIIFCLIVSAILVITLLVLGHLRRMRNIKAIIRELHNVRTDDYDRLLKQLDSKNNVTAQLLTNLITLIKSIDRNDAQYPTSKLAKQIKETILDVADNDFWYELKLHMDRKHNGLISELIQAHNLSKKDEQFIELCLCGFSNVLITIIMGYSTKYISNKRKNLSEKLGVELHYKSV